MDYYIEGLPPDILDIAKKHLLALTKTPSRTVTIGNVKAFLDRPHSRKEIFNVPFFEHILNRFINEDPQIHL